MYPDEIDRLKGEDSQFSHGFNSGCLAAIRYVMTAMEIQTFPDEESNDPKATWTYGGLQDAEEDFPDLDT